MLDTTDGVVGVDQECRLGRQVVGEGPEGLQLARERLDVAVGHRPDGAQSVESGGLDVAGAGETDHPRDPGCRDTGLDPLGATEAELHQIHPSVGGQATASCLRGQRGLEAHLVEKERLNQLCFGDGGGDLQQGFVGQDDPAFGHRPHVASKPEVSEGGECGVVEPQCGQVVEVVIAKTEPLQPSQAALEPGGDEEAPVRGELADEQAEGGKTIHRTPQVGGGHVELVEVGRERESHRESGAQREWGKHEAKHRAGSPSTSGPDTTIDWAENGSSTRARPVSGLNLLTTATARQSSHHNESGAATAVGRLRVRARLRRRDVPDWIGLPPTASIIDAALGHPAQDDTAASPGTVRGSSMGQ